MVIWSILTQPAWEELQRNGCLRATRSHAEEDFLVAYDWMVRQMEYRLAASRPSEESMPIWGWRRLGDRRKPDLRTSGHLPKGVRGVRVECRVENNQVLLSDFELWHYVLNYWYLPKSEKDGESFDKKLACAGLSVYDCSHHKRLPDVTLHREVEKSWERIFDLSWSDPGNHIVPSEKDRWIQATAWELLLDDVVESTEFVAR